MVIFMFKSYRLKNGWMDFELIFDFKSRVIFISGSLNLKTEVDHDSWYHVWLSWT